MFQLEFSEGWVGGGGGGGVKLKGKKTFKGAVWIFSGTTPMYQSNRKLNHNKTNQSCAFMQSNVH